MRLSAPGIRKDTAMNLPRTGAVILAVVAASMLAASMIDAGPFPAVSFAQAHDQTQGDSATAAPAGAVQYNHPANTPADCTWASLFSAHWR